ncbi:hypothetical protein RI367_002372 [Sorochytrium milnesiophthora]
MLSSQASLRSSIMLQRDSATGSQYQLQRQSLSLKPQPLVLFDVHKKEVMTPTNNLKLLQKRLKHNFKIGVNKEELSLNRVFEAALIVFAGPREKFTAAEARCGFQWYPFAALKSYLEIGGSVLYLTAEGGEAQSNTNFNYLLEEYGMSVNSDAVTRTSYFKYFHPKEVLVTNGVLNRELNRAAGKKWSEDKTVNLPEPNKTNPSSLTFVYPFGATLNVQKPSIPILSSGSVSYPMNQPIAAVYPHPNGKGKLAVIGSVEIISDAYLEKEENSKIIDIIAQWLTSDRIQWNSTDANEPDVSDYHYLPDTTKLSQVLRSCLQESEELPKDFTTLFDHALFKFDLTLVPQAIRLYDELRLKHEPLALIQPQFETPLPPLQPAVFPPIVREIQPPPLELFDLDDHFASPQVKLAQLTNKCTDDDLEYYIREAGEVLGVTERLPEDKRDAKNVLHYVFTRIASWKKLNQAM